MVHLMVDTTMRLGDTPHPVMMVEILRPVEISFESPGWTKLGTEPAEMPILFMSTGMELSSLVPMNWNFISDL